ncbi:maleylpyruvate isomerase N-terminal domain-containing protein [Pedobacter heparinus]|uniref:maleylpyruvate isomerase N-terminal domain-containing protein n=1 Tax=Pedobacter heparinus TaxID=984 RepID=UPI00292E8CE8|nr:maleylpyruvate isomerase N-terminal domain-containing protein [Pedobacter heparinus]
MDKEIEIKTLHLFPLLNNMLINLLKSLTDEEWAAQTIAKLWKVKDVAAHLLDTNLRTLSISRDGYIGERTENINSYQELVAFLNNLNMTWTNACKRLSPDVLIFLLESTGQQLSQHLNALDPFEDAVFPVAWAGQKTSVNWFNTAREYTEKFLHQQQIRDAVGKQGIMTRELYYPFLDTFMYAFPHTFKDIKADDRTVVSLIVTTEIGGQWNIVKDKDMWILNKDTNLEAAATVKIAPDISWKLFSKSWTPKQVIDEVEMTGNEQLGQHALQMVSVMA